jgi:hypothetical protein
MTITLLQPHPLAGADARDDVRPCEAAMVDLVERELGHPCDDPDEFEDALFRLGLAA